MAGEGPLDQIGEDRALLRQQVGGLRDLRQTGLAVARRKGIRCPVRAGPVLRRSGVHFEPPLQTGDARMAISQRRGERREVGLLDVRVHRQQFSQRVDDIEGVLDALAQRLVVVLGDPGELHALVLRKLEPANGRGNGGE